MKLERRAQRQAERRDQPASEPGVDRDIADIVPGPPQPEMDE